jgi:1,4-dihydroxy-2-naphthoate octaprenyltransferase
VAWEAAAALGLAFAAAVVLAFVRGPLVALMGLAGVAGACAYTSPPLGLKYRAMGDLLVFLMMGPGLLLGSQYVLTGSATPAACALSLAIGALVTAILHANNMRDAGRDRESGFITLAARLGVKGALALLLALLAIGYAVPAAMAATGTTGLWVLAPLATLPFAAWQAWFIARNVQAPDRLADVDRRLAGLHSMYGLALVLGTVAGRL